MFEKWKNREIIKVITTIIGSVLYAIGINLFITPKGLYTGGLIGLCQLIRTFLVNVLGINIGNFDLVGLLFFILNIPILLLAFKSIGRRFLVKTIITVITMTVALSVITVDKPIIDDMLTSCLIGSIIAGVGTGLTLMSTASGGGLDVLGIFFTKKYKNMSFGKVNIFINGIIFILCFLNFPVEIVVYSIISIVFYSIVVDKMHQQNISVKALIFTKAETKPIESHIFNELERGITYWDGKGAFTNDATKVLCICLSKYEVDRLKTIVHTYDKDAFFIFEEGVKVDGNFTKKL